MSERAITEDDLHAYVDEALPSERRAEVEAYLSDHPDTAKRVRAYAQQRDALRSALKPIAAEPLPARLNLSHLQAKRRRRSLAAWRQAAAAVVLLGIGGLAGWSAQSILTPSSDPSSVPTGIAALQNEAAANFAVFAPEKARPVEIAAADKATFLDWAADRLGRTVEIPDLTADGYRYIGGRIVATEHGPAALFLYDNDMGNRLVMLSRNMQQHTPDTSMTQSAAGEANGFTWISDGVGYSLFGKTPPETLHPIANKARAELRNAA